MKNRVIFTVTRAATIRDIMKTEILTELLKNYAIVIAMNFHDEKFELEMAGRGIIIERLPIIHNNPSVLETGIRRFRNLFIKSARPTKTHLIKHKNLQERGLKGFAKYFVFGISQLIFSYNFAKKAIPFLRKLFEQVELILTWPFDSYYDNLIKKHNPIAVVSYCHYDYDAIPLLRAAKRNKSSLFGFIVSWDNITTKGEEIHLDKVSVWNNTMKNEAMQYLDYKENEILVSGAIPMNNFIKYKKQMLKRADFFKNIKLNPKYKTILYTTGTRYISPFDDKIVEFLANQIQKGTFGKNVQLMVRVYGRDESEKYARFKGMKNVFIDDSIFAKVSEKINKHGFPGDAYSDANDIIWLGSTLMHSDVIVNVASSITIDAAVFDKPIVNVAFNPEEKALYYVNDPREYYSYEHYSNIVKSGGVKLAYSENELTEHIKNYLSDPKIDSQGRQKIREQQCYLLDGKVQERISSFLLDYLKKLETKTSKG